jgi:hypothetical protein
MYLRLNKFIYLNIKRCVSTLEVITSEFFAGHVIVPRAAVVSCHIERPTTPHVGDSCLLQMYSRGIHLISSQIESNSLRTVSCQPTVTDNDRMAKMSRVVFRKSRIAVWWRSAVKWVSHCRDGVCNCSSIFCTLKMEAAGTSEALLSTKVHGVVSQWTVIFSQRRNNVMFYRVN